MLQPNSQCKETAFDNNNARIRPINAAQLKHFNRFRSKFRRPKRKRPTPPLDDSLDVWLK